MSKLIILGISGRKGSGKSTLIKELKKINPPNKSFYECSIAGEFKRFCVEVLGLTWKQVSGSNEDKESLVEHLMWENFPVKEVRNGRYGPMKAREVMEHGATDIVKAFCEDVAARSTLKKVKSIHQAWEDYTKKDTVALIDSVRFPSDVKAIQDNGGYVLRLTRNPYPECQSECETALDPDVYDWSKFDKVFNNDNVSVADEMAALHPWFESIGVI